MALPKQKFREIVFQILYSRDIGQSDEELMTPFIMKELSVPKKAVKEAQLRVQDIYSMLSEIDEMITGTSRSYDFNRIQSVERNVLRLAVYEMYYDEEIPPKVAIAEAIRLSRKFSTPESANFINAILDALYKKKEGKEVDSKKINETFDSLLDSQKKAEDASQENE